MHILFLSRWFPYPLDNGSRIRIYNLLRILSQAHTVDLVSFHDEHLKPEQVEALESICRTVKAVPYQDFQPSNLRALLGFFAPYPRSVIDTMSQEMVQITSEMAGSQHYDLVIASQVDMIPYGNLVDTSRILEEVELGTLFEQVITQKNPVKRFRRSLMWHKWNRYLRKTAPAYQGATVVSKIEHDFVSKSLDGINLPLAVIPNGVDSAAYLGDYGPPKPNTLIYSGSLTYRPNLDAVRYFIEEILPRVQAAIPSVQLIITGRTNGVQLDPTFQNQAIRFTGYLADIRPTIAQAWINIVPLRLGGGTRLKILESMAISTPVIATSKGAEGLELRPDHEILIADEPEGFANAVIHLLKDENQRKLLAHQGRQAVTSRYDWQVIGKDLENFISRIQTQSTSEPPSNY